MHPMNRETVAVLRDALTAWPDIEEAAADWLASYGAAAARPFTRQLRADFLAWYASHDGDDLIGRLVRLGLARVDWRRVAGQVLARAARQQRKTDQNDLLRLLRERERRIR